MKNDVSFLVYTELLLYEHQTTVNPNMPLRDLFYVTDIYSQLTRNRNLYGPKTVKIPEPVFIVFYNGKEEIPERSELLLSDLYEACSSEPDLELKVVVLNINLGYNEGLMEKCRSLREYAVFVDKVRKHSELYSFKEAIEKAVEECIAEGILKDFLERNRAEVIRVSLYEYDEEKVRRWQQEEARELGKEEGQRLEIINLIRKKRDKNMNEEEIADMLEQDPELVRQVCDVLDKNPEADNHMVYGILNKK